MEQLKVQVKTFHSLHLSEDLKKKEEQVVTRRLNLAIVKSKLLKQLSNNYPNFLKKDLRKIY